MRIDVLFFGVLKDLVGRPADTIELHEGALVQDVLNYYSRERPQLAAILPTLAIAVNREYSAVDQVLRDGDEVGLLPPVSGGSMENERVPGEVKIVRERIDAESI